MLENDLVEAIVALPNDIFYNTGIATYLWILSSAKPAGRKGTVQLIDATGLGSKLRKSVGSKRVEVSDDDRAAIVQTFALRETSATSKVFENRDFAYWTITVERPLRLRFQCTAERIQDVADHKILGKITDLIDALGSFGERLYLNREEFLRDLGKHLGAHRVTLTAAQRKTLWQTIGQHDDDADICYFTSGPNKGQIEPDPALRDTENIPFGWGGHPKTHDAAEETIDAYFEAEVRPHVPDAWVDRAKTKTGYEIPFTRHFYQYVPPRPLEEIDADLNRVVGEILEMLREVEK